MEDQELKELLLDDKGPFLKQLKHAALHKPSSLEYWEKRPENFSKEVLLRYLRSLDTSREFYPNKAIRESSSGKYGETGFLWVFIFEDDFKLMGENIKIYMKGFFFEEDDPRGVEIQSFKRSRPNLKLIND